MIYHYENGVLTEYAVTVDTKKLEEIRESIIENCSIKRRTKIICIEKDLKRLSETLSTEGKSIVKDIEIIGKKEINNKGVSVNRCHECKYQYTEYIYPEIVNVINAILEGNNNIIQNLFNTNDLSTKEEDIFRCQYPQIHEAIEELKKFSKGNKGDLDKVKSLINRYEECEITLPKLSIKDYYAQLQTCIELKKVQEKSVDINELNKLKEQYGDNWYNEIIDKLNDLKKLESNIDASIDNQFIKRIGKSGKSKKKN